MSRGNQAARSEGVTRRRFLVYSGASVATVAGGALGVAAWRDRSESNVLLQLIAGDSNQGEWRRLGELYLEDHPEERSRERLLQLLGVDRPSWLRPNHQRVSLIAQAVQQDYDNDRVVLLDGWVLSTSEARIYALAAVE